MRAPEDRLSPGDRALWRRVAATVRPLRTTLVEPAATLPAAATAPAAPDAPPPPAAAAAASPTLLVARRRAAAPRQSVHPEDATLDGGWDRRARTGQLLPDATIDLHGHGVEAAHHLVEARLRDAAAAGARVVLVITGKGSRGPEDRRGVIRASLADWLQMSRLRPLIAAMRAAHPRHGGAGAFYVVLRRPR